MSDSAPNKSSLDELDTDKPFTAFWFFHHSEQFYALTRFSYFGFLIDATFVNAHHTVEYLLKSILMKRLDIQTLKKFGHNLKNSGKNIEDQTKATRRQMTILNT